MTAAPLPDTEFARLMALARYEVLDTLPEQRFDRITALAAQVLDVPVVLVNFVDQFRQWGKSCVGLDSSEAAREHSFCAWAILEDEVLVVPDAGADPRFAGNPMVTGEPHVHLYAGAPLVTPDGHRIGTLCITDCRPHVFGPREQGLLRQFAVLVMDALELRLRERELEREVEARARQVEDLRRTTAHAETLSAITALFDSGLEPTEAVQASSELLSFTADVDWAGLIRHQGGELDLVADWNRRGVAEPFEGDLGAYKGGVMGFASRAQASVFVDDYPAHPRAIPQFVQLGVSSVAVLSLGEVGGARYLLLTARVGRARPWRGSDRALLEAAGRSVRGSLERHARLLSAQTAALRDGLTGLLNRRAFDEAMLRRSNERRAFAAVVIDLDGLKAVNDLEGHERGDALLTLFGQALRAQFRGTDGVYRLGGDEFVVLLDGAHLLAEEDVLERIDLAVATVRAASFSGVGASVGVAYGEGQPPTEVVQEADARMYAHKRRKVGVRG